MQALQFRVTHDIDAAQKIWGQLTPRRRIYDEWAFRLCFQQPVGFQPFFVLGLSNRKPVGLLALQYNTRKNVLEFFGGTFMEYNRVLLQPEFAGRAPEFYNYVLQNMEQDFVLGDLIDGNPSLSNYEQYDATYTVPLEGLNSMSEFIDRHFSGKSKNSLKRKITSLEKNHSLQIRDNDFADLDLLAELNIKRFGPESSFRYPSQIQSFRQLGKLPWELLLQTFIIDGKKQGVAVSLIYKDFFVYLMSGVDVEQVSNLGSYVVFQTLTAAIARKKKIFDAGRNTSGWKDRWHLTGTPVYSVSRNP